jgi:hypothetical protein
MLKTRLPLPASSPKLLGLLEGRAVLLLLHV